MEKAAEAAGMKLTAYIRSAALIQSGSTDRGSRRALMVRPGKTVERLVGKV